MPPKKIVLADDDLILRELAETKLRAAGHDVTVASNGAQALQAVSADGADLVISDLNMPDMDGFELTKRLRADPSTRETPVIVITGSEECDAVDRAFAAGATSFLAKPINWTLFNQAVMFVLRASDDHQALRDARDRARAGEKFKDELLSVMSHELRTPLNAIIGFGQLLGERFQQEQDNLHREYSEYIVDSGRRLLGSISDMLLASDARTGPISITEDDVTAGVLLEAAIAQAPHAKGAAAIETKIQDPDIRLLCDEQLLARAISKLIDNALKFSPQGEKIVVGAAQIKNGGLAIMVQDAGPGISKEKMLQAAAAFEQSEMSSRRTKEGLGLGLPLAQAISKAHGATFRLEAGGEKGVRAFIVMPPERVLPARLARTQSVA